MATTTVTEVMENLYKLPLLAVKTAKSTPGSKEEVPKEKDVFLLKCRSYYGKNSSKVQNDLGPGCLTVHRSARLFVRRHDSAINFGGI